jgi:hypothetical protein
MRITTVSPTRLKTALKCEFKYFLTYEWGWADDLFTYTFASEFGTAVHSTLEAYAKAKGNIDVKAEYLKQLQLSNPFLDDMKKAPSRARATYFVEKNCATCPFFNSENGRCGLVNKHVEHFEGCPKGLYEDGLKMIEDAIKRYDIYFRTGLKTAENPTGKVIGVECPAGVTWGSDVDGQDIVMNGFIDLVIEYDPETIIIIDYKTGYSVPTHEEFIEDLQPRMYSFAAKKMFPNYKYVFVQFDYFRGKPIEYAFTHSDDERTRQEVVALFNRVKQARTIRRRAQDHYCKHLCNRSLCDVKWAELLQGINGSNPNREEKKKEDD